MKIVIEIDDARFKDIRRIACVQLENCHFKTVEQIIANGTPLPKGHGSRCDLDNHYIGYVECMTGWCRRWTKDNKQKGNDKE